MSLTQAHLTDVLARERRTTKKSASHPSIHDDFAEGYEKIYFYC